MSTASAASSDVGGVSLFWQGRYYHGLHFGVGVGERPTFAFDFASGFIIRVAVLLLTAIAVTEAREGCFADNCARKGISTSLPRRGFVVGIALDLLQLVFVAVGVVLVVVMSTLPSASPTFWLFVFGFEFGAATLLPEGRDDVEDFIAAGRFKE